MVVSRAMRRLLREGQRISGWGCGPLSSPAAAKGLALNPAVLTFPSCRTAQSTSTGAGEGEEEEGVGELKALQVLVRLAQHRKV